jgi:uncharacterized protein with HEPN domain
MSSRDVRLFLQDMLTSCDRVLRYTEGMNRDVFFADTLVFDATMRNIEILGEACKQIPPDLREQYPAIPWRKISGLRDIVIHHYFGIDENIVWDVIRHQIPHLRVQLAHVLHTINQP